MYRYVPVVLDEPVPVAFIDNTALAIGSSAFFIGFMFDQPLLGLVLAYAGVKYYMGLKSGAKKGAGMHAMWASGSGVDPALKNGFPPSYENELIT